MIWDRLSIIRSFFGQGEAGTPQAIAQDGAAAEVAARWQKAFNRDPQLAEDLIR